MSAPIPAEPRCNLKVHAFQGACYNCCNVCNVDGHKCPYCGTMLWHDGTQQMDSQDHKCPFKDPIP